MTEVNRRNLLGLLLSFVASPALPKTPVTSPTGMWQDLGRTIPATNVGDLVMLIDEGNGWSKMTANTVSGAPTLIKSKCGRPGILFDGRGDVTWHPVEDLPFD